MDIKIKVQPMKKADIPNVYTGRSTTYIHEQFMGIVKEFHESDSECISLLDGNEVDAKVLHNPQRHIQDAAKALGIKDKIKVVVRSKAFNVYITKVGE